MKIKGCILTTNLLLLFGFCIDPISAAPFAEVKVTSKNTHHGNYYYTLKIINQGPILPKVATPADHTIYTSWGNEVSAAGKLLNQDDNIVLFGLNTGLENISITKITNADSAFIGSVETGWDNSQVITWHLPFGTWPEGAPLKHGETIKVSFSADVQIKKVVVWVGGSDDEVIWVEGDEMAEDQFGIYNASGDGKYLATFLERHVHVKMKDKHNQMHEHKNH